MEHKLSELKKIQTIKLSDQERAYLRGHIAQAISTPISEGQPLFQRGIEHGLRIALSSFLFVIFVGGSISAIASNSLPGDPLYSFKINVNEEIKGAFLNTPEEKVAHQKNLVEKRVGEIKTLAETKTLTKEKQATAQKALDSNIKNLSTELNTLSDTSPNTALSITADLEESIQTDKEAIQSALETSKDDSTVEATIKTIDNTLKKVSEQEVKIISKEIENISKEINATPTDTTKDTSGIIPPTEEGVAPTVAPATSPVPTPSAPVSP